MVRQIVRNALYGAVCVMIFAAAGTAQDDTYVDDETEYSTDSESDVLENESDTDWEMPESNDNSNLDWNDDEPMTDEDGDTAKAPETDDAFLDENEYNYSEESGESEEESSLPAETEQDYGVYDDDF